MLGFFVDYTSISIIKFTNYIHFEIEPDFCHSFVYLFFKKSNVNHEIYHHS
jgi:hypothetical protein